MAELVAMGAHRRTTFAIVGGVLSAALLAGGAIAGAAFLYVRHVHAAAAATGGRVTETSRLSADRGAVVFADDFHDPTSGWNAATLPSGTSFGYALGGYVVTGKGTLHHFAEAPFQDALSQLSMAVTATQTANAPPGAGFGVTCWRGDGDARVRYEFVVLAPGTWYLERDGGVATLSSRGVVLDKGTAHAGPGASPITIVGMCVSIDSVSTRLALFVNGKKMVDRVDRSAGASDLGWLSGLDVSSRDAGDSSVMVTRFEVRDLTHS
ncbi:MAG TPA: hypothetical protein VKT20_02330 [Candidatus Dormibacteraeota bacterium]|nr:hypothetical protein [Candidatus Dormibacteraeota bacterium]